jgi:hypothetical protein
VRFWPRAGCNLHCASIEVYPIETSPSAPRQLIRAGGSEKLSNHGASPQSFEEEVVRPDIARVKDGAIGRGDQEPRDEQQSSECASQLTSWIPGSGLRRAK